MGKHVIILGAGASVSSGYPLANKLTLLMADPRLRETEFLEAFATPSPSRSIEAFRCGVGAFESDAARFLREACFETMDSLGNFCSQRGRGDLIPNLKRLMRFCLSLHNALEENFGTTDYRQFVQALLRKTPEFPDADVAVLSFNYDPFLDYLLHLAVAQRRILNEPNKPLQSDSSLACSVTSGFSAPSSRGWLGEAGFCHLKLHGVLAPPPPNPYDNRPRDFHEPGFQPPVNSWDLLGPLPIENRLSFLMSEVAQTNLPPVVLPWEILHEDGRFRNKDEFSSAIGHKQRELATYFDLFQGVWERARREVQEAEQVSFVGLSMSPLMKPGIQYLFEGKDRKKGMSFVVVNPDVQRYSGLGTRFHPNSATGRTRIMLDEVLGTDFPMYRSRAQGGSEASSRAFFGEDPLAGREKDVTQHASFADFIRDEMG